MKKFISIISIALALVILSAAKPHEAKISVIKKVSDIQMASSNEFNPESFYNKQCTFCHSESGRLAPQMKSIKNVYLNHYSTKQDFINGMTDFVLKPHVDKKKYKGDTGKYDVMPKDMFFDRDKIKAVVEYIYSNHL